MTKVQMFFGVVVLWLFACALVNGARIARTGDPSSVGGLIVGIVGIVGAFLLLWFVVLP